MTNLRNFITELLESRRIASQAYKDAQVLRNMTDRELSDIGITRGDINRVCYRQAIQNAKLVNVETNSNLQGSV